MCWMYSIILLVLWDTSITLVIGSSKPSGSDLGARCSILKDSSYKASFFFRILNDKTQAGNREYKPRVIQIEET